MVCIQVYENGHGCGHGRRTRESRAHVCKPVIIHNLLHSVQRLTEASARSPDFCVEA